MNARPATKWREGPSATLSFHLKELKQAGVVGCEREGRCLVYRADFDAMRSLLRFLTENCCRGPERVAPEPH